MQTTVIRIKNHEGYGYGEPDDFLLSVTTEKELTKQDIEKLHFIISDVKYEYGYEYAAEDVIREVMNRTFKGRIEWHFLEPDVELEL